MDDNTVIEPFDVIKESCNFDDNFDIQDYNYRPLPNYLEIKKSPIEGDGLFTKQDIPQPYNHGISHIIMHYDTMMALGEGLAKQLFPNYLIRTPLGGYVNHCDNANCILVKNWARYELVNIKPIKRGEELTLNYSKEICGWKKNRNFFVI